MRRGYGGIKWMDIMLKARKKESVRNKKVKVINSTLLGGNSSIGLQIPQNLKDCVDLRKGADKELVKELDNVALDRMSTYMELNKQSNTTQDYVTRGAKIGCSCGEYYNIAGCGGRPWCDYGKWKTAFDMQRLQREYKYP